MSKTRETLRKTGGPHLDTPSARSTVAIPAIPDVPVIETKESEMGEEVPFIEVGPRRSIEASAAVLASIPAPRKQPATVENVIPVPTQAPMPTSRPSALPRPHNVLFRSLTPPTHFAPELVAFHDPGSNAGVRYVDLLESMLGAVVDKGGAAPTALLLAGARTEIGATTVLLNVAITAARQGLRVAVLDANLRRPAVAARLGLESAPGLTELLDEEVSLDQALRPTEQNGLTVLTSGAPATLLTGTEALRSVLMELRSRFELVLVDGPRWDGKVGVNALASASDALFLVVPAVEADEAPVSELVKTLPEQGVRLAGCILTGD